MDDRQRRIGINEAIFRETNERLEAVNESFKLVTRNMTVVCECGDINCTDQTTLSLDEYELLREDSRQFLVKPNHVFLDVEDVVKRTDRYWVVRKRPGAVATLAEALDERD